ncbi:MAG TPA: biotin-dependent carboxyltransferase family protein [Micromonosporaceae bacterium]|nr:biotin-dependent carboxyltransferase family protein [Micromonosporaceae bacterium]
MTGALDVRFAGPHTTIQDLGRPGLAHLGVPRSGALDGPALALANRLVGNPVDAAGLEITMSRCSLRATTSVTLAVTGATAPIRIAGRHHAHGGPVPVRAGALVEIGPPTAGVRTYVAVAGGIDVPPVLGSRSTDTLSGLGPPRIRDGDVLPVGPPSGGRVGTIDFVPPPMLGPPLLRIRYGPRDDWFTHAARELLETPYTVSVHSNRVGARLAGPTLARVDAGRQLPSEGIVAGAVQVTADGQPLVFLADHPTTGGYPVIAVVDAADLPRLAQARPGDTVTMRAIREGHGPQR